MSMQEAAALENCKDLEQRLAAATAERERLAHVVQESVVTYTFVQYCGGMFHIAEDIVVKDSS